MLKKGLINRNFKQMRTSFDGFIKTVFKLVSETKFSHPNSMPIVMPLFVIALSTSLGIVSCSDGKSMASGNPSEILSKDIYDKIQKEYNNIDNFEHGTAVVIKDKYGLIDYKGKEILPCIYDSIYPLYKNERFIIKNKKCGLVNDNGDIIIDCIYDDFKTKYFNLIPLKLNTKWGFFDHNGNNKIQLKFDDIKTLTDSIIVAKYNNMYGICDYNEKIIIPYEYDDIIYRPFDEITTFLISNNKYGLANDENKIITECIYDDWAMPYNGHITLTMGKSLNYKTKRYGMIEQKTGKVIIPFEYEDLGNYSDGLIMAELNKKYGYINIHNKIVIPFIYTNAGNFSEGLANVYKSKGYVNTIMGYTEYSEGGYINTKGDVVIPFIFADPVSCIDTYFSEGLAVAGVAKNNIFAQKYGYINKKGEFIISPIFDDAKPFDKNLAQVEIEDKIGFVDKKGKLVIQCIYDNRDYWFDEKDSIICLEKDSQKYYFDYNGNKAKK